VQAKVSQPVVHKSITTASESEVDDALLTKVQRSALFSALEIVCAQANLRDIHQRVSERMEGMTLREAIAKLKHKHLLIKFLSAPIRGSKKAKKNRKLRPTESHCTSTFAHHMDEVFTLIVEGDMIQASQKATASKHFTEALK